MGELFDVQGLLRFSPVEVCPAKLRGKTICLKARDAEQVFELQAEAACISGAVRRTCLSNGTDEPVVLPLRRKTVAKVVTYLNHHKEAPEGEIMTPLPAATLEECGATRWDAKFVDVDRGVLFDLNLAASILDIAGLFFLTSAAAALTYRDTSVDGLRKTFGFQNDLPKVEEEMAAEAVRVSGKARQQDARADIAALAVTLQATTAAAQKEGALLDDSNQLMSTSWRKAYWRAAVLLDWKQLEDAPEEVRGDRDLLMGTLMASQGLAFTHAAPELKADREVVLEATKYLGAAFQEAARELRADRSFVLEAVRRHGAALAGASEELRRDRSLVLEAAQRGCGSALQGAADDLRLDPAFLLEVVAADPSATRFIPDELLIDKSFVLRLVQRCGQCLRFLPQKFKADRDVVTAAVGEDLAAAVFAHAARRSELGLTMPWDQDEPAATQVSEAGLMEAGQTPGGPRMLLDPFDDDYVEPVYRLKLTKAIFMSGWSTMTGNTGQANYCAANAFLDKLPCQLRPEIQATTLMWGGVTGLGMRWKSFGSNDVLLQTPDALLGIDDARKILRVTCAFWSNPEWYAGSSFDKDTRNYILWVTAGNGTGGGYKPSEAQALSPKASQLLSPLSGWPTLLDRREEAKPVSAPRRGTRTRAADTANLPPPPPNGELDVGARVALVGLESKDGSTGVVIKRTQDGKFKVRLDDGTGNALVRSHNLKVSVLGGG